MKRILWSYQYWSQVLADAKQAHKLSLKHRRNLLWDIDIIRHPVYSPPHSFSRFPGFPESPRVSDYGTDMLLFSINLRRIRKRGGRRGSVAACQLNCQVRRTCRCTRGETPAGNEVHQPRAGNLARFSGTALCGQIDFVSARHPPSGPRMRFASNWTGALI